MVAARHTLGKPGGNVADVETSLETSETASSSEVFQRQSIPKVGIRSRMSSKVWPDWKSRNPAVGIQESSLEPSLF